MAAAAAEAHGLPAAAVLPMQDQEQAALLIRRVIILRG